MSDGAKIFTNGVWAVTPYGIEECRAFGYWLNAEAMGGIVYKDGDDADFFEWGFMSHSIGRNYKDKSILFWPIHYSLILSVDIDCFLEVFMVALGVHAGRYKPFSTEIIKDTLDFIENVSRPMAASGHGLKWAKVPRVVVDMEKHLRQV